jgi:hypothetical protein
MAHRDDREALDAKLEAQGRELAETKEELERLRAANLRKASELERMRQAVGSVGGAHWSHGMAPQTGAGRMTPAVQRQIGVLVMAASVLVGGLSFSAIHLAARAHPPHRMPIAAAPVSTTPVHATFGASIVRVAGLTAHEAGEVCRVDATFQADPRARVHAVSALGVTCGEETLFVPPSSALADAIGVAWASESDGHVRYELAYAQDGSRLESWDGAAVLSIGGSRIELAIDPLSAEVELALDGVSDRAVGDRVMVRAGHVTASTSIATGTACLVARRPAIVDGFTSRVVVRCGERTLYGADGTGYTYPSVDARLVVDDQTSADDGDARMTLDLVRGTVHLEDGARLTQVSVDIALDPTGPTTQI